MALVEEADGHRVKPPPARPNRKRADGSIYTPEASLFLFSARIDGKAIEPAALTRVLNRNRGLLGIGDATIHDLRRSFATWHGEIGTPPEFLSGLLNHAPVTMTAKVYNRAANIKPKCRAMERWCDWLELVIAGKFKAAKEMQGAVVLSLTDVA
jgi:integrase